MRLAAGLPVSKAPPLTAVLLTYQDGGPVRCGNRAYCAAPLPTTGFPKTDEGLRWAPHTIHAVRFPSVILAS